jgi:hypothetical protein
MRFEPTPPTLAKLVFGRLPMGAQRQRRGTVPPVFLGASGRRRPQHEAGTVAGNGGIPPATKRPRIARTRRSV